MLLVFRAVAPTGKQTASKRFVDDYRKRWKALTDCSSAYKVSMCKGEKDPPAQPAATPQQPPTGP